jgi:hypothetical protein
MVEEIGGAGALAIRWSRTKAPIALPQAADRVALACIAEEDTMDGGDREVHKFDRVGGMTPEGVFNLAFKTYLIPILQNLKDELGATDVLGALAAAATKVTAQDGRAFAESVSNNDMATWIAWLDDRRSLFNRVLVYDVVERTERVCEIRVTECLWAKTFREAAAPDIGYAVCCAGDAAMCEAYNPKLRLERTKTLMLGDDYCDYRWVLEE